MSQLPTDRNWVARVSTRGVASAETSLMVLAASPLAALYDMDALAARTREGRLDMGRIEDRLCDNLITLADTIREEAGEFSHRTNKPRAPETFGDTAARFDEPLMHSWLVMLKLLEEDFTLRMRSHLDPDALDRGQLRAIRGSAAAQRFVAFLKGCEPTLDLTRAASQTDDQYPEGADPRRVLANHLEALSENITYAIDEALRKVYVAPDALRR